MRSTTQRWRPRRRRGRPLLPLPMAGTASSVGTGIRLSCWLAGPTSTSDGVPRASTIRWRLTPGLPRSVGLGPVPRLPSGGDGRAVERRPAPVDLPRSLHSFQQHPVQCRLHPGLVPVAQPPPAAHGRAASHLGWKHLHARPDRSTNKMPVSAARSGRRGRPPFGFGGSGGNSGAIAAHRSSGTRGWPCHMERIKSGFVSRSKAGPAWTSCDGARCRQHDPHELRTSHQTRLSHVGPR